MCVHVRVRARVRVYVCVCVGVCAGVCVCVLFCEPVTSITHPDCFDEVVRASGMEEAMTQILTKQLPGNHTFRQTRTCGL